MSNHLDCSADLRCYAAELIGTAALVFFAAGSVMICSMLGNLPGPVISGLASGAIVTVMVWSLVDISGAHFNPALTLTLALLGDFPAHRVPGYIVAQMTGSALAAAFLYGCLGATAHMGANLPNLALGITPLAAFLIECVLSFTMMIVVRGAFAAPPPFCQFAALPIGAIVGVEVMMFGPIAGAAMNPARAFGPYIFLADWRYFWIYLLGPVIGLASAGYVWQLLRPAAV